MKNTEAPTEKEMARLPLKQFIQKLDNLKTETMLSLLRAHQLPVQHREALHLYISNNSERISLKPEKPKHKKTENTGYRKNRRPVHKSAPRPAMSRQTTTRTQHKARTIPADNYVLLWKRLRAWWDGVDVAPPGKNDPANEAALSLSIFTESNGEPRENRWSEDRLKLAQVLWGTGHSMPECENLNAAEIRELNPRSERSCLDLSTGLGGGLRNISRKYNLWVTGYEREKELAKRAKQYSRKEDGGFQVNIRHYDPAHLALQNSDYDIILAREIFFSVKNRSSLFQTIAQGLKPEGSLIFTDFILPENPDRIAIANWYKAEPFPGSPWTKHEYGTKLEQNGFHIRKFEDRTEEYIREINRGWARVMEYASKNTMSRSMVDALMDEASIWLARSEAMKHNLLQLCLCHVISGKSPTASR